MKRTEFEGRTIEYCIFDPTGNITALVTTAVDPEDQPAAAAQVMRGEPAVEQVGFVQFAGCAGEAGGAAGKAPVRLRMAGGEFYGNATMCSAALYQLLSGTENCSAAADAAAASATQKVLVSVSGAALPLEVSLRQTGDASFEASVQMPPALSIEEIRFAAGTSGQVPQDQTDCPAGGSAPAESSPEACSGMLPLVRMGGIDHIIIEKDSAFFGIKDDSGVAEKLVREWCALLGSECLGLMFLEGEGSRHRLTPLVYVPGADTTFWENSCASGSAAAGMHLASKAGGPVDVSFSEPAGELRVESDPQTSVTVMHGSVIMIAADECTQTRVDAGSNSHR